MILSTMTGNFIGWACWDVHACYVRGATSPSHSACWLPIIREPHFKPCLWSRRGHIAGLTGPVVGSLINERDTGRKRGTYVPNSFHTHMLAI